MPREFMFVTMWREGLCFWMRMAQANAEMGLRMWQTMGFPPPRPLDAEVEALCAAAARPAEVPDPVTRKPVAKPSASGTRPAAAPVRGTAQKPADAPAAPVA